MHSQLPASVCFHVIYWIPKITGYLENRFSLFLSSFFVFPSRWRLRKRQKFINGWFKLNLHSNTRRLQLNLKLSKISFLFASFKENEKKLVSFWLWQLCGFHFNFNVWIPRGYDVRDSLFLHTFGAFCIRSPRVFDAVSVAIKLYL